VTDRHRSDRVDCRASDPDSRSLPLAWQIVAIVWIPAVVGLYLAVRELALDILP
jgi:hypothetical protein